MVEVKIGICTGNCLQHLKAFCKNGWVKMLSNFSFIGRIFYASLGNSI
jgi:hypothetical protein